MVDLKVNSGKYTTPHGSYGIDTTPKNSRMSPLAHQIGDRLIPKQLRNELIVEFDIFVYHIIIPWGFPCFLNSWHILGDRLIP